MDYISDAEKAFFSFMLIIVFCVVIVFAVGVYHIGYYMGQKTPSVDVMQDFCQMHYEIGDK